MNIGFLERFPGKQDSEMEVYYKILDFNNINYNKLSITDPDFLEKVMKLDLFIYKWGHLDDHHQIAGTILPIIENHMHIKCFPDYKTSWHYDDKVKQYFLLKFNNFPVIKSWIFWDKKSALNWVQNIKYPIVFKLKGGAGSLNVVLVVNRSKALQLIRRMFDPGIKPGSFGFKHFIKINNYDVLKITRSFLIRIRNLIKRNDISPYYRVHKNYAYFQEYQPDNLFDIRVTTAGNRVHAFRRFVRKGDFRASGSDLWDIDPAKIDKRVLKIALEISEMLGFQSMAYDFVYDVNGDPVIVEMSYLYGGAGYPDFMNGYWDKNLVWHPGRFWPQYFELLDLLKDESLLCPEMEAKGSYLSAKMR